MQEEPLVSANVIHERLGIPRSTLYKLADAGKIPQHSVRQPWHTRKRVMFRLSEVEAALKKLAEDAE